MNGWELPVRTPLAKIFEWCWEEKGIDRLLLAARLDSYKKEPVLSKPLINDTVSSLFGESLLERKLVRRWPGTELSYTKAVVYRIAFTPSFILPMARLGNKLQDWQASHEPPLPEDPCLYREGDEWPVFVSVTHERDAWILSEERPPFCLKEPFEFRPESLLVPPATHGFVGD